MARLWDVGKTEPIKVGKASPTEGTLPTSVYLVLRYLDNFDAGVKANAMIGGDSAWRLPWCGCDPPGSEDHPERLEEM